MTRPGLTPADRAHAAVDAALVEARRQGAREMLALLEPVEAWVCDGAKRPRRADLERWVRARFDGARKTIAEWTAVDDG